MHHPLILLLCLTALLADSPLATGLQASQRWTPPPLGVDIGHIWLRVEHFDALYHNGATDEFVSFLAVNTQEKRAVVALHNGSADVALVETILVEHRNGPRMSRSCRLSRA